MKKALVLFVLFVLCMSVLAGCAGKEDPPANNGTSAAGDNDGTSYGIDLTSTEVQQMSEQRATAETLTETVNEWLEGGTMFPAGTEMSSRTYQDFVDHIGCDANEYTFDTAYNARVYTWIAEGKDVSKVSVWFTEENGTWNLYMSGAANLL